MPALLRGFLEQTFRSTFIFPDAKPDERLGFSSYSQRKALRGKSGCVVATMQMPGRWAISRSLEQRVRSLRDDRQIALRSTSRRARRRCA